MTMDDSRARYLNPARHGGAVPPLARRVLVERPASFRILISVFNRFAYGSALDLRLAA